MQASTRNKVIAGVSSLLLASAFAMPAFAAKKAISDEEMDMVTAAGQPIILNAVGSTSASVNVSSASIGTNLLSGAGMSVAMDIGDSSQSALRALTLNNIAGENQVANGLNVQSIPQNARGSDQLNAIVQTWGSKLDLAAVVTTVAGASATCPIGSLICKPKASSPAISTTVLSAWADQILNAKATAGAASASYDLSTRIALSLQGGSQNGLAALTVNNVTGLNQVANGTNIASFGVTVSSPNLVLGTAGIAPGASGQTNVVEQNRGFVPNTVIIPLP